MDESQAVAEVIAEQTELGDKTEKKSSSSQCETAVKNVHLIDLERKQILKDVDVTMAGGRITSIRPHKESQTKCKQTVNGEGKYMMPGLVDMHTHANAIFLPRPGAYERITNVIPLTLRQAGTMMLTAGVTAFLDLCSAPQDEILAMRDQQRSGGLPFDMPDIYSAGSCITSKWLNHAGDPAQFNQESQIADVTLLEKVDDYDRAYPTDSSGKKIYGYKVREKPSEMAKIDRLIAKKPDVIKVFYTSSYDKGAHYAEFKLLSATKWTNG